MTYIHTLPHFRYIHITHHILAAGDSAEEEEMPPMPVEILKNLPFRSICDILCWLADFWEYITHTKTHTHITSIFHVVQMMLDYGNLTCAYMYICVYIHNQHTYLCVCVCVRVCVCLCVCVCLFVIRICKQMISDSGNPWDFRQSSVAAARKCPKP